MTRRHVLVKLARTMLIATAANDFLKQRGNWLLYRATGTQAIQNGLNLLDEPKGAPQGTDFSAIICGLRHILGGNLVA